ncbi:hypothetical protein VTJ49DRAFT_6725 [Mycothermus thermophilus]|uniref:LicD/FKTN/FKRP nucleotidyltransferase domain-containing protein n=1 Tax=Humicola insolens TaxID=85995 RepID=A0ABR3VIV3_HUMIN
MKPCLSFMLSQRVLVFLSTLLILSAILSTAAIARSGGQSFSFSRTSPSPSEPHQPSQPAPDSSHQQPPPQPQPQDQQQSQQQQESHQAPAWLNLPVTIPAPDGPAPPDLAEYKYFHEAGKSHELQHYDIRFFRGEVPYSLHREVLTHLIRAYLKTFSEELKLETWLAHGTLLGWFWNGHNLPWDFDVDVQVTGDVMLQLSLRYNQSVFSYTYESSEEEDRLWDEWGLPIKDKGKKTEQQQQDKGKETDKSKEEGKKDVRRRRTKREGKNKRTRYYYLDINPFATRLDRGFGHNAIDARWIDVATGMYVDITALMERDPKGKPGIISCKNLHHYTPDELFPLRETEFEGVPALVPYDYEKVLGDEYGKKSMVVTEFHGHRFDTNKKEWIKIDESEKKKEKPKHDDKKEQEKKPEGEKKPEADKKPEDEKKPETDDKKPEQAKDEPKMRRRTRIVR